MIAVRVRDYDQLRAAIAARRRELGLRQLEVDDRSGCQPGYQGKIEAGCRKLGDLSLPMILAGLDLDLYVAPRPRPPEPAPRRTHYEGCLLALPAPEGSVL
jgi:hypothetical protein